jgi:tungstate transport system substrate-binding protein
MRTQAIIAFAVFGFVAVAGAGLFLNQRGPPTRLVLATTTSTVDTGLLDYIKPFFDRKFGANLTWLYLGTGQAIAVASRGDADILLVHDRAREDAFVRSGNGTHRVTLMYSDFVILGPLEDPAGVGGCANAALALARISEAGQGGLTFFVSRGDKSGTNALELRLWSKAGLDPKGKRWYLEAGQGMAPTIRIANEKSAYTISDRGTWLKLKSEMGDALGLVILLEGDPDLLNPYGLILLNSDKYPSINAELAEGFFLFMISDEGQTLIEKYRVGGEQLFVPLFGRPELIGLPPEREEVEYWLSELTQNGLSPPAWLTSGGQGGA